MTSKPPPFPEHVRQQLPEWGPAMRKVRHALLRGFASESSIGYETDLDAWTCRAALELLALVDEVELVKDAKWRGRSSRTTRAGTRARRDAQERERETA